MFSTPILVVVGIVVFVLIALIAVFITKYRTAGPDEALIVTGSYLGTKNVHTMIQETALKSFAEAVHLYSQCFNRQNHLATIK